MDAFAALKAGAARSKAGPSAANGASTAAGKGQNALDPKAQPWVEKYRPKNIDSVGGQEHTTRVLKKALGRADVS